MQIFHTASQPVLSPTEIDGPARADRDGLSAGTELAGGSFLEESTAHSLGLGEGQ